MTTHKQNTKQQELLTSAYHDYGKNLNLHAFFKVGDRVMSEDLVQNTFLKTWKYLVKGGKIHIMKAFLYHILNALIIDEYRKHKATSLDVLLEKGFEPSASDSNQFLDVLDGKVATLLIKRLPEKYRNVMSMRYEKMLSLKEISLVTGQTKNAIAVQIHRGLQKLKLLYSPI